MAYGLRITNDNSELLIDSDYVNPTFVTKLEFNSTPTSTETGIYGYSPNYVPLDNLHQGYTKNVYTTTSASLNGGNYMVLWKLPDNGNVDVWYNFPKSTMDVNRTLTCEIYSSSTSPSPHALPTAYIFATDVGSLSTLSSDAPALRLYNSSEELTFNSSFTQLIPYNFTDNFTFGDLFVDQINNNLGFGINSIGLTSPTNAIYLLPQGISFFRVNSSTSPGNVATIQYDQTWKRVGNTIYTKQLSSFLKLTPGSQDILWQANYGMLGTKSIMVVDGDLYQGSNDIIISPTAPTYDLTATSANVNETTNNIVTVTLTTTNVSDGNIVYYTITGIDPQDLVDGALNGSFTIQNNTATATITVAADGLSETLETLVLTLIGLTNKFVSINITDTSRSAYGWSAPSATSVNEGSSIYLDFNGLYNDSTYPITFGIAGPADPIPEQSQEQIYLYPDLTLTYAIPPGASFTRVTVTARADLWGEQNVGGVIRPEGPERWRVYATVMGVGSFASADITINDTALSSISTASNYIIGADYPLTITVIGGLGKTVWLYPISNTQVDVKPGSPSTFYVDSNNFTASTTAQGKALTTTSSYGSSAGFWLRNGDELLSLKLITTSEPVYNVAPIGAASVNEGDSIYFLVQGTGIQNGTYYWTATNSGDFGTSSGAFTITDGQGSFSVTPTADTSTEGSETFTVSVHVGSTTGLVKATSIPITIGDTSKTPEVYNVAVSIVNSASTQFANENEILRITITSSLDYGHPVHWTWEGVDLGTSYGEISLADISSMRYFDPETNISGGPQYTNFTPSTQGTFSFPTSGLKSSNLQLAIDFILNNDGVTEQPEYGQFYLRPIGGYTGVVNGSVGFFIRDVPIATYSVAPNVTSVNEGGTLIWTITTANVTDGTTIYWQQTGTNTAADYNDNLSISTVVINNNTATITRVVKPDAGPYEGSETASMSLFREGPGGTIVPLADSATTVTIYDTSVIYQNEVLTISPSTVTYPSATTLSITGGTPNTVFRYGLDNLNYPAALTLDANGSYYNPNAGPGEVVGTHTVYVKFDSTNNTRQASWSVVAPVYNEIVSLSPTSMVYPSGTTFYVTGGTPNGAYRFSVNNTNYDSPTYYLDGNGNITGPTGVVGANFSPGTYTIYVYFVENAHTRQASWTVIAPAATYSFSRDYSLRNEGQVINYTVTTTNVANGTRIYWINYGSTDANDFTSYTNEGFVTINNNSGSFYRQLRNDNSTEGEETVFIFFYDDAGYNNMIGYTGQTTVNDTSINYPLYGTLLSRGCVGTTDMGTYADGSGGSYTAVITYNATSCGYVAPTYSLARSTASVNEGSSFTITFTSNQSGSYFGYTITGVESADINGASLTGYVTNGSVLTYTVTADNSTEGTQYFTITLDNYMAQVYVTFNDTSINYPLYGTLLSQGCVGYTRNGTYADGSGGSYTAVIEYNATYCGYVAPTYSLTASAGSVNEGGSITFYVGGSNIPDGTYYWQYEASWYSPAAVANDLTPYYGYVSVTSNSGSFTISAVADGQTEGAEYFVARLYSSNGVSLLATSSSVTISDDSTTPIATTPTWQFHRTVGSINWTVPTGRTVVTFMVVGGGGGGRSVTGGGGGGGAGGTSFNLEVPTTPGQVLTFTVGAGGGSNSNGSQSSVTGLSSGSIVSGGGGTGSAGSYSSGGTMGSGNYVGSVGGGGGAGSAGGGGGGIGSEGYSATAQIAGDGGDSYPLFDAVPPGPFNICGGGGGAGVEGGIGGTANNSGGPGAGAGGTYTNNGGNAVDHGGGGGGAKSGGTGGSGFRGMIAWYG